MKKLTAILMAVVMLFAMTVVVSADEVLISEDILFMSASSWTQMDLEVTMADLVAALQTPGAELRIHRSAATPEDYWTTEGGYEKFCLTDNYWAGRIPNDAGEEINVVRMGTYHHTIEGSVAAGNPYDVSIDCLWDDGIICAYDGNAMAAILVDSGFTAGGPGVCLISNTGITTYDIVKLEVVVPDVPYVAPEVDEPAEETPVEDTPAEETPVEDTPAETGLTLAVLPAVIALAVVAFKKR